MNDRIKKLLGEKAAEQVLDGMVVGLGSGTTAKCFIEALGEKVRLGLSVKACASSNQSARLAIQCKIPLVSINRITALDLTVDGCDQFDVEKRMIKGKGGALLREKILSYLSTKYLVVCTEEKRREVLGGGLLPVEVAPFADQFIQKIVESFGFLCEIRTKDKIPYVTDNQNHIIDIQLPERVEDPQGLDEKIKSIPGVFETGFFLHSHPLIFLGKEDQTLETLA